MVLLTNAKNTMERTCEQRGSLKEKRNNKETYTRNKIETDEILGTRNKERETKALAGYK